MFLETDKQTINDLEITTKSKDQRSVFSLYNYTRSIGGKKRLEHIFNNPVSDITILENRVKSIKYFQKHPDFIDIDKEWLDFIEYYLLQRNNFIHFSYQHAFWDAFKNKFRQTNEYYLITRGIQYLIDYLDNLFSFFNGLNTDNCPETVAEYKKTVTAIFQHSNFAIIRNYKSKKKLGIITRGKIDNIFREQEIDNVRKLLDIIYEIDVYKSVVKAMKELNFTLPEYTSNTNEIIIENLYHPFLEKPVSNSIAFNKDSNVCFITGPNMAGKSTFMKSFGIAIYLSHLGFPVPATYMKTSVFNGLFTTINLSDNINKGYSHYYNEVLRIKYVAEMIRKHKNVVVVFDELFRGTNVKDAYEASLAIIQAFSKLKNSIFAISTHIVEVAEMLKNTDSIYFKYFEIMLKDGVPQYLFKLKDGITDERLGIYILNKENVISTIENAAN